MGADLFETYAVTAIGAVFLGYLLPGAIVSSLVVFPMVLGAIAIVASVIGIRFVRLGQDGNIMNALYRGVFASAILSVIGFFAASYFMLRGDATVASLGTTWLGLFFASLVGIVVTLLIMFITEYYTATRFAPVRRIAKASETGSATNIISGLAVGMQSTAAPVIVLALATFLAFVLGGLYGIAVAAVAMLSVTGMIVAMDTYGPITDNAGGIAEMSDLPSEVRENTDALDAVGNTTKAVTKGYAVGSAALAALVLFADYAERLDLGDDAFRLNDPIVLVGLLIGAMLPFIFSAFLMESVGKAAGSVIEEVRRQFREISGIMEGTAKPEYGRAVDIVTAAALKEMTVPGLLAVFAPLIVGFLFGPVALGGLLIGVTASGLMMALMMSNGGGAWDNAKKYIEDGNHGGKGSVAHEAAVVGDTVGDPYKDTAGPSINPLIKVINTVALIFAGLIASVGGILL
jgi:K(+)-stimulated pyrophosphate-energized sodium pump